MNGLHANQFEFTPKELDAVIEELKRQGRSMPPTLEQDLNSLSCLHVEREECRVRPRSYQFLHLSFQEFFAAQWLVNCLLQEKPLGLLQAPMMGPYDWIRQHKYHPRYEMVWRFTTGLLPDKVLGRFFDTLEQGPRDLIGIQHQPLVLYCLQESNNRLPPARQAELESNLYAWLRFEVNQIADQYEPSLLGRETVFPEGLLLQLLEDAASGAEASAMVARTLGQRAVLSDKAQEHLIKGLKDEAWDVRRSAADALGQHSALSYVALKELVKLLKDKKWEVRKLAARALGQGLTLSPEILRHSIARLKDATPAVRRSAVNALGQCSDLPLEALRGLTARLNDEDGNVRQSTVEALGKQSDLSAEGLGGLITRLQDDDYDVRQAVVEVLGKQSDLSAEGLGGLIARFQDRGEEVRSSVVEVLGKQSELPTEGLIDGLKDNSWDVRQSVVEALGKQSNLPPEALEGLITRLLEENEDWRVRQAAVEALGKQSDLSPDILLNLIELSKDEDWRVRSSATEALGPLSVWQSYRLLATEDLSLLKKLYSAWLIKQNFRQIVPVYLEGNRLSFYTSSGLQSVCLTQEMAFREAIWTAQEAVGIPLASRVVKPAIQSDDSVQI